LVIKKLYPAGINGGEDLVLEDEFSVLVTGKLKTTKEQLANGLAIMGRSFTPLPHIESKATKVMSQDAYYVYQIGPSMSGGDLSNWMEHHMPIVGVTKCKKLLYDTRMVIEGTVKGIMYMGKLNWAHRDVHPSNILLEKNGQHIARTFYGSARLPVTEKEKWALTHTSTCRLIPACY